MEDWQLDFEWGRIRTEIKEKFNKKELPDLNAILFLIGINEVGVMGPFTKEAKQDLMHVAVCRLLESEGVYEQVGEDDEGWPHFEQVKQMKNMPLGDQSELLKMKIVQYFDKINNYE